MVTPFSMCHDQFAPATSPRQGGDQGSDKSAEGGKPPAEA